jgi:hypothetical protein
MNPYPIENVLNPTLLKIFESIPVKNILHPYPIETI